MRVGVLGAGLAGLAAGCELADLGHEVTLIERRPWAGGKTYSFADDSGEQVDNGQHVFLACTTEYVAFLKRLGTLKLTRRQKRLRVPVFDQYGHRSLIAARNLPPPLHLAQSLLGFRGLSPRERFRLLPVLSHVARMSAAAREELPAQSFADWLIGRGQTSGMIERFWDFLVLPTLNCRSHEASVRDALFLLQEAFLASPISSAVGVSAVGLSDLHVAPAVRYIEERGGRLLTGERVRALEFDGDTVSSVTTDDARLEFDACVCALPPWDVTPLLPAHIAAQAPFVSLGEFAPSPIINLHLWFDQPVANFAFAAFTGSELQWVFNRSYLERWQNRLRQSALDSARMDLPSPSAVGEGPGVRDSQHLVISLSGAGELMALDKQELADRLVPQLRKALRMDNFARVTRVLAIKEPAATFIPAPGLSRPSVETPISNFVLAGAYTNTGWPATMESAVRSGLAAARSLHARHSTQERSHAHGNPNRSGDLGQFVPA
jgi:squalene-associated FAD-dependent desaturase